MQTIIIRSQRVEQHQITRIGIIFDSCLDCLIWYSLVLFKLGKMAFWWPKQGGGGGGGRGENLLLHV